MNRRVDQKLHSAKSILAAISVLPPSTLTLGLQTALLEAALFQLGVAYRAYLRELLLHSKVDECAATAQDAVCLLQAHQLRNSDIDELAVLERDGEWPARLCAAHAEAVSPDMIEKKSSKSDIALRDVTMCIDAGILAVWLQQFYALINRQREHAREW